MNDALTSFRGMRKDAENNPLDKLEKLDKLDSIDNLQAASELVAETVEQKSNEVIGAVEDNTAANELTAENTQSTAGNTQKTYEELQKLNSFSSQMNEKLRGFGVMMERRFSVVSKITSGLDAIEKAIKDEKQPEQTMPSPQPVLPTVPEQQNNDNYPTLPKKPKDDKKKKDKNSDRDNNMQMLIKAVRGGFKETVGVSNKIFSMLFKMTVTALLEVAKWGAILLGIVVAIDTLMIHFRYWSTQFNENFGGFMKKAGGWGTSLTSILASVDAIKDFWAKKQYGDLVWEIVKGIGKALKDAFFQLDKIVTQGVASVLRTIPMMGDVADTMEYNALKQAKEHGGYKLTPEENKLYLRKKKEEDMEKGKLAKAKLAVEKYNQPLGMQTEILLSPDEQNAVDRYEELKSVSEEKYLRSGAITSDAESDLKRNISMLDSLKPNLHDKQIAELDANVNEYRSLVNDDSLLSTDRRMIQDLLNRYDKLRADKNAKVTVTAPPPDETDTAKQATAIEQGQLQNIRNDNSISNTANVANTQIYNNNRTVQITRPQTSTPSPGLLQKGIV